MLETIHETDVVPLGVGYYTVPEAARLLRTAPRNISRWLDGYSYRGADGNMVKSSPLWRAQLPRLGDALEIGFRDLIELRFVLAFLRQNVPLNVIRRCLENARAIVGEERPFSTHRFRTDGRSIFLESLREAPPAGSAEDGSAVIDLKTNQLVFKQVVERTFKDLDIEEGLVVRWRPYGGKPSIVIDPARSFGKPLAADFGADFGAGASRGGRGVYQARGEAVRGSRISRQRRGQLRAITDGRVRVIFDENLSPALARALNALFAGEHEVAHIEQIRAEGRRRGLDFRAVCRRTLGGRLRRR